MGLGRGGRRKGCLVTALLRTLNGTPLSELLRIDQSARAGSKYRCILNVAFFSGSQFPVVEGGNS